ncbi:D-alanyl-D-alanine carboxypeptidase family protein [Oceanirhabdus sp. W0125-5]|uniref:D-alanyl-D-alanine carboxypeptidase family protein n=1 Tax=Oceanirhabdus sp. W0125-5 TaxID=2999116 RepID=UPI0022F31EDB|nr:D-alanyl-D-alanine carboxypeptidase family protein [Oceanirhabdus sp. W0125-5]WBW96100.1 D-alanyl-D-alanine carboxypeptidase [Oceanirhabdus sp. W0125-5]
MKNFKKSLWTFLILFIVSFNLVWAEDIPNIIGTQAIVYDYETGEIIYTKDIDSKAYPASITKLMTALLLAENFNKNDMLTYTQSAADQPAYSYGKNVEQVLVGDKMSAENAMYALLLYSGNDIAYMIADNVSGDSSKFVDAMNAKAQELGMNDTTFVNPNGLDDNTDEHLTTPYDIALMTKAALGNKWIADTMATKKVTVSTQNSIPREIENRNSNLLDDTDKDGCIGGKTGYTTKAGRCLTAIYHVKIAEEKYRTLIGVVMNSEYNYPEDTIVFEDMNTLMEYGFNKEKDILKRNGDIVKSITASYKAIPFIGPNKTIDIPLIINEDIKYYKTEIEPEIDVKINTFDIWKIDESTPLGTITVKLKDYSKEYKLYSNISSSKLLKDNIIIYVGLGIGVLVLIILLVVIFKKIFGGKKRRYRY